MNTTRRRPALRRYEKCNWKKLSPRSLATGPRATSRLGHPFEALACSRGGAWWSLLGKVNYDAVKSQKGQARGQAKTPQKAKRAASVVLVTDPSKRSCVERVVRCFLAQESSEPLELLVVDDDDGSDGDAPAFWVELMKRDRRIRYVKLPEGTSLGEKRRIACEESRFATLVHFSDDAVYAPSYVSMITELTRLPSVLSGVAATTPRATQAALRILMMTRCGRRCLPSSRS